MVVYCENHELLNAAESSTHSYHYPFEAFRNEKKKHVSINGKFINKFDVWP